MESTKLIITEKKPEQFSGDMLVYCLEQSQKGVLKCENATVQSWLEQAGSLEEFRAKSGKSLLFYPREIRKVVLFRQSVFWWWGWARLRGGKLMMSCGRGAVWLAVL